MDTLDTKIFRELVQDRSAFATSDIRRSFRVVARKLDIDEVTVRKRIKKMQGSGFLQYWMVLVNPRLLGLGIAQLLFDVLSSSTKYDLIEKLKLLPGAFVLVDCFGSSMYFSFFYQDETSLQRQVELVSKITSAKDMVFRSTPIPECKVKLAVTDWRIIRSLHKNPRKSYGSVARELGVSSRTVKRRLQRMVDEKAVFVVPSMNPGALDGVIQADLLVSHENPRSKAETDGKFMALWDDHLARAEIGDKEHSFFNLFVKNVSQAHEVLDWTKRQPGVRSARIDLVQDRIEFYPLLSGELAEKLRQFSVTPVKFEHR